VALGRHGFSMFGIAELSIKESRNEIRLFGPFDAAQAFVGFLVLQSMLSIYCYLLISNTFWKKLFWSSILLFNLAAIIASGTRSGFLSFIIGLVLLAPVFILKIGFGKTLHLLVFGLVFLGISSYTINKYTQFNLLFDRLSGTEIYGIEVDSRKGLIPLYIEKISEKPLFGHRPMFGIDSETMDIQRFSPPHNLYLFICFTNGLFGLLCFLIFLNSIFGRLRKAAKTWNNERFYLKSFPTICKAIFFTFLVQQFFISFARFSLGDYQQYIFLVFGIFCVLPEIANKDFSPEGASSYHRLEKAIPIPK
jgi:O-antigen ligase